MCVGMLFVFLEGRVRPQSSAAELQLLNHHCVCSDLCQQHQRTMEREQSIGIRRVNNNYVPKGSNGVEVFLLRNSKLK